MNEPKTFRERWTDFKFRIKIFGWYLITEPWRQFKEVGYFFVKIISLLNKTLTWAYILVGMMILALFLGKKVYAGLFLLLLLALVLVWEWQDGYFMHRYREHVKEKIDEKSRGEDDGKHMGD